MLYSVYDSVSKEFSSPVMLKNHDVAKRWFHTQALKNVDPSCVSDLRIYVVGSFDIETGLIDSLSSPIDITDLADSVEVTKEEFING